MKAGISAKKYLPTSEKSLEDLNDEELLEYRKKLQNQQSAP